MRYCIIKPMLDINHLELQFSNLNFSFLVLATVVITAAGYVINDYFDTKTDRINRPNNVLVGTKINRRFAMLLHIALNVIGISLGIYLSFSIGEKYLSLLFIMIPGVLWFYSTTYKRQLLIGNLIVAVLTALVPILVIVFELSLLNDSYSKLLASQGKDLTYIFYWVCAFGFFAFLTTLIREIIKDIEDFEGDYAFGRKTLPVMAGVKNSKFVVFSIGIITVFSLLYILLVFLNDTLSIIYFTVFLIFPIIILLYKLLRADIKDDYSLLSKLTIAIMLSGILYAVVANFIIIN
ncbi:MAG: geranylgeranylglycerol-phosphate geranylgeranyltransferase [Bacteroidales bacterium]|nr:geranylgeranylglycerol-phosphate geranylgeranyltransferase [Bacteroidales bacterium]